MAIAAGRTGAPQIHVGQAAHVEEKIEKAVACRTKRAVAEELVASLQKAKRKKGMEERELVLFGSKVKKR